MGVRGLTTYINNDQDSFLKPYLLHNSSLVIDGNSLCAQLYLTVNCFSAFGGDYDKYASHVKKFFQVLRKCKITCYVIFDGSYENKKLKTAYQRLRSKINGAARLDTVTQTSLRIFPLFLRDVFRNVLSEINVPYTVCEFEADDEIAAMARYLNCPVLSYDSDFFIYKVLYIPFNTLDNRATLIESKEEKYFAMECKIYKVQYLIEHFGGFKEEMLPLLATLLGNDFVEKRVFKKFFSQLKLAKSKKKLNDQQRSIHALFKWLVNETRDSAIEKIIGRLRKSEKRKVFIIIQNSIDGYNKIHCESLKYFGLSNDQTINKSSVISELLLEKICEGTSDEEDEIDSQEDDSESSVDDHNSIEIDKEVNQDLPNIIKEGLRQGFIPQSYINLYTLGLYFCSPQAEDYTQEDSFLSSLPILRFGYDLLTNFSNESFIYVSRHKEEYKRLVIDKEYAILNPYDDCQNTLENVKMLPLYFKYFLKEKFPVLDYNIIAVLPDNYQLVMISILWWVTKCNVSKPYVYSLFICYIMLTVIDEKTGMARGHNYFHNKYSKKLEEIKRRPISNIESTEIFLNKNKVLYEDCLLAASKLLIFFEIDKAIQKHPKSYDTKRVHVFAQLQCCLQQFNYLNTICRSPYHNCKVFDCFNGTFLYNVSNKLEEQIDQLLFIENNLFKGAQTVLLFFKSLCNVFDQCIKSIGLVMPEIIVKRRGRRKKKSKQYSFLHENFESDVMI